MNQTIVVGNTGNDAEMRFTAQGTPVTSFSLAAHERWTDRSGEKQEKTTWFRVTVWGKSAEVAAQWIKKGNALLVVGAVSASAYTSKKTGEAMASLELRCQHWEFVGNKSEGTDTFGPSAGEDSVPVEDDLPF